MRGFTLGVADILMTKEMDVTRRQVIEKTRECGPIIAQKALDLAEDVSENDMKKAMASAHNNPQLDTSGVKLLDHSAKVTLDKMSRQINE